MHQRLMLVMECAEESATRIEQATADQLKPFTTQTTPIDALFPLEGHLKVATPVRHGESLGGLHAALQYFFALHLQCHLLVVIAGMEFSHLMVKEILFVLEGLRAANVLQQKVSKCGRNDVPILRGKFNARLGSIVYDEDRPM